MLPPTQAWYANATSDWTDWPVPVLLDRKRALDLTISVVVPARNEAATIADVVTVLRRELVDDVGLVDELVVMDSDSTDATARIAADSGAIVHATRDVAPAEGTQPGKGEALWKSLFVTTGDVLVFIDADLTLWGPHFVTGLLGPLLHDDAVDLVKGYYDRVLVEEGLEASTAGGRVTELTARPLLNLFAPELAAVVQPLAGEWAVRRRVMESLPVPPGYGVEIATLIEVWQRSGIGAVAQVDLGRRAHVHQNDHDLGLMAAQVLLAAAARFGWTPTGTSLCQFSRDVPNAWRERIVATPERAPARDSPCYGAARHRRS